MGDVIEGTPRRRARGARTLWRRLTHALRSLWLWYAESPGETLQSVRPPLEDVASLLLPYLRIGALVRECEHILKRHPDTRVVVMTGEALRRIQKRPLSRRAERLLQEGSNWYAIRFFEVRCARRSCGAGRPRSIRVVLPSSCSMIGTDMSGLLCVPYGADYTILCGDGNGIVCAYVSAFGCQHKETRIDLTKGF